MKKLGMIVTSIVIKEFDRLFFFFSQGLPSPQRAIAFTQTQLSQVLQKLGHLDEALQLLSQASSFHLAQAKHGLLLRRNQTMEKMEDDTGSK